MSKSVIGVSHAARQPASPLVFKSNSAWTRGPPRSLSTKSDASAASAITHPSDVADGHTGLSDLGAGSDDYNPMTPNSTITPTLTTSTTPLLTETTSTTHPIDIISPKEGQDDSNASPIISGNMDTSTSIDPPPRPKRNPLRRESSAGMPNEVTENPNQTGRSSENSSASVTPTQSLSTSAISHTSNSTAPTSWSSFLAQTKTVPPITTELPPISKEPKSRSRSRRKEQTDNDGTSIPLNIPLNLPPMPSYPPPLPPAPPSSTSVAPVKSKLQADAQPFVPTLPTPTSVWPTPTTSRRTSAAIIIKRPDGEEVDIRKLSASTTTGPSSGLFSAPVPKDVKLESEDDRKRRLASESGEEAAADVTVASPSTTHESTDIAPQSSSQEEVNQSQESAIDEEEEDWGAQSLTVPVLATSPPTGPLDSTFPTSPLSSTMSPAAPNPNAPPLTRTRRERSRRGSKRGDSANRTGSILVAGVDPTGSGTITPTPGLNAMTRTRSGGLTRTRPPTSEAITRTRSSTGEVRTRVTQAEAMIRTRSGEGMTRTRSGEPRKRPAPGRLDLSGLPRPAAIGAGVTAVAIANAKMVTDLAEVFYPEGVNAPSKDLNQDIDDGKFRYDREFLLQFRGYCTERPFGMEELEGITVAQPIEIPVPTHTRSRRRRSVRSNAEPTLPTPILTGNTLVVPQSSNTLGVPNTPLTAEDQSAIGTIPATPLSATLPLPPPVSLNMGRTGSRSGRSRNGSNAVKMAAANTAASPGSTLPPPIPMMRSKSHGSSRAATGSALPPPSPLDRRSGSQRARKRSASTRNDPPLPSSLHPGDMENVKPLEMSANRWAPSSVALTKSRHPELDATVESEEIVEKKVKALLNKLTLEKFDSISDQIVSWANRSEKETDGATLQLVIRLVFDKATDEAAWSAMYARLCRKMMERVSMEVSDENVKDRKGELVVGGQLFRQYLLSRCQADFEKGWSTRETLEEQQFAVAAANGSAPGEIVFSDEYYALQKAKRRGLGLVKFIGELFKLGMLTERIMHRCILKLLDEPAEDDIESVCQLLKTVGVALSGPKGEESMNMYFGRMKQLSENQDISQRIRFMLLDVIDMRAHGWVSKTQVATPSTLAQVHEAAAKEAGEKSASASKPIPIIRNTSRRGQNRSDSSSQKESDGWVSTGPSARSLSKATGTPTTRIDDSLRSPSAAKSMASSSGGFHSITRLSSEPGTSRMTRQPSEPGKSRSRRGGEGRQVNRRTSVDFVHLDAVADTGSSGRKRLQLLPRTVGSAVPGSVDDDSAAEPSSALAATFEDPPAMTEEQAQSKIEEDIKEFMQIRDLDEAVGYFESLPADLRHLLVDKFVGKLDSKQSGITLICELFERIASLGICSAEVFEQGFAPTMETLDDIALDVPTVYSVVARLLRASKLPRDVVDRLAGTINVYDMVLVHPRDKLMKEFDGTA